MTLKNSLKKQMFNILTQSMPEHVGGAAIRTDYRIMLLFDELMHDDSIADSMKIIQALKLFYKEPTPLDLMQERFSNLVAFYSLEDTEEYNTNANTEVPTKKVIDYQQDANLIYSAFLSCYGIRLTGTHMHWYEFNSLIKGLPADSDLAKIMGYRAADLSKFKGEELKRMRRLQEIYAIKDTKLPELSLKQREQAFLARLDRRYEDMNRQKAK